MKKYDVYGISHALVDMEFEVAPEFLKKHGIQKGIMTLVDEDRQHELVQAIHGIQHKRSGGGSGVNTAVAVAQCGGRVFCSCQVSDDEWGDFYLTELLENGVQTNLETGRPAGITGKCLVFITPDADRTFNTFLGISEKLSVKALDFDALQSSEYLYVEGYLVTSSSAKATAREAKKFAEKNGVKTSLTFSDPAIIGHFRDGFDEILGDTGVDLLFCNEKEAFVYAGTRDLQEAVRQLKKIARQFVITQGPRGAYVFDGEKEIDILTIPVDPVDTTGAGDLFAGSFLYGITQGHSFGEAGKLACHAASTLVTQFGARLQKEQMQEIVKQVLGGENA